MAGDLADRHGLACSPGFSISLDRFSSGPKDTMNQKDTRSGYTHSFIAHVAYTQFEVHPAIANSQNYTYIHSSGTHRMDYANILTAIPLEFTPQDDIVLLEPYHYLGKNPGKEIRSQLIEAFNYWLDVKKEDLEVIQNVVGMLHTASLLMDDVEDSSVLRRGSPVAHLIYGIPQTINTANYVYFLAYQEIFKLRPTPIPMPIIPPSSASLQSSVSSVSSSSSSASSENGGTSTPNSQIPFSKDTYLDKVITDEMLSLHRGQGLELFWRDSLTCPSEEEYVKMVLGKTGGLFRIAVRLMMAKSECDIDFVQLVNLISIYFQIRDDYMNLQSSEYAHNKNFAEDLTEGKFSFPTIHSIHANPSSRLVINTLQKKSTSPEILHHCVNYMRTETHSFEYTREVLNTLSGALERELGRLQGEFAEANSRMDLGDVESEGRTGKNVKLEAILKKLADIPL